MNWQIVLTPTAKSMLSAIKDRRVLEGIRGRIDGLIRDPEKQGKPLGGELVNFRSLRAVGQRYRIIYRVESRKVVVIVVAVGLRKEGSRMDIYELARKIIKLGLLK